MSKRNYTHVQALLPEIQAMVAEGKSQREVAQYYGFRDKQVVKSCLSGNVQSNENWKLVFCRVPKAGQRNLSYPEMS